MEIKPIETIYNGYRFRSRLEARWAVFFDALGVKYEYEPEGFNLGDGINYLPDFRVKCYGTRGYRGKEWPEQISEEPFDLWIEVKGKMTQKDAIKIKRFANYDLINQCPLNYKIFPNLSPHSDYDDHKRRWQCSCGYTICDYKEPLEGCCSSYRKELENGIVVGDLDNEPWEFVCPYSNEIVNFHSYEVENPILVVGQIPEHGNVYNLEYYDNDTDISFFNYELIDGDYFGAYPAADKNGHFYLFGADSSYINDDDVPRIIKAYDCARQARFEHGECD